MRRVKGTGSEYGDDAEAPTPWVPRHNHFTRDVKPEGQCPGCDDHREVSR